jgi:hypothetical protein
VNAKSLPEKNQAKTRDPAAIIIGLPPDASFSQAAVPPLLGLSRSSSSAQVFLHTHEWKKDVRVELLVLQWEKGKRKGHNVPFPAKKGRTNHALLGELS